MATAQEGCLRTRNTIVDWTGKEGYCVVPSSGNAAVAGANAQVEGLAADEVVGSAGSPKHLTIQIRDRARGRAGAAFSADVLLASDATGRLVLATTGQKVVGKSCEAATAAGQLVGVELYTTSLSLAP